MNVTLLPYTRVRKRTTHTSANCVSEKASAYLRRVVLSIWARVRCRFTTSLMLLSLLILAIVFIWCLQCFTNASLFINGNFIWEVSRGPESFHPLCFQLLQALVILISSNLLKAIWMCRMSIMVHTQSKTSEVLQKSEILSLLGQLLSPAISQI